MAKRKTDRIKGFKQVKISDIVNVPIYLRIDKKSEPAADGAVVNMPEKEYRIMGRMYRSAVAACAIDSYMQMMLFREVEEEESADKIKEKYPNITEEEIACAYAESEKYRKEYEGVLLGHKGLFCSGIKKKIIEDICVNMHEEKPDITKGRNLDFLKIALAASIQLVSGLLAEESFKDIIKDAEEMTGVTFTEETFEKMLYNLDMAYMQEDR